jgi:hypothetical protein
MGLARPPKPDRADKAPHGENRVAECRHRGRSVGTSERVTPGSRCTANGARGHTRPCSERRNPARRRGGVAGKGNTVSGVSFKCPGRWREVAPGVGECERGLDCEALELLDDFDAYRVAHERHRDRDKTPRGRSPDRVRASTSTGDVAP